MRAFVRAALPAAMVIAVTAAASAQDWRERAYDPAPGSKWIIERVLTTRETTVENGLTTVKSGTLTIVSELTVEAKTPDGFRVAYRRARSNYDGNHHDPATMRLALAALNNILIRASTDRTGKPQRVDNLEDIRTGVRTMIDRVATAGQSAAYAAQLRGLLGQMTAVDSAQAAQLYLDDVPTLAFGQNTGLRPGEVRRGTEQVPNSVGPAFVKNNALSIVSADTATGKVRYALTESYDPDSLRAFLTDLGRRAGISASDVQKMVISLEKKTELDVEGGMTRRVQSVSTTSNDLMGNRKLTVSHLNVTVRPAP
jgi:hypothetical protein